HGRGDQAEGHRLTADAQVELRFDFRAFGWVITRRSLRVGRGRVSWVEGLNLLKSRDLRQVEHIVEADRAGRYGQAGIVVDAELAEGVTPAGDGRRQPQAERKQRRAQAAPAQPPRGGPKQPTSKGHRCLHLCCYWAHRKPMLRLALSESKRLRMAVRSATA